MTSSINTLTPEQLYKFMLEKNLSVEEFLAWVDFQEKIFIEKGYDCACDDFNS